MRLIDISDRVLEFMGVLPIHKRFSEAGRASMPETTREVQEARQRDLDYSLVGRATVAGYQRFGVVDRGAPSETDIRRRYRGLASRLSTLRADAFVRCMFSATVERMIGPRQWEEVEFEHGWTRLLRNPNPFYDTHLFWLWGQMMKDLSAGAFYIIEFDPVLRIPKYLHPVFKFHGTMRAIPNPMGTGIEAFSFERRGGGEPIRIPAEAVVWLRHPSPVSPFESASLIEIAAHELDQNLYMAIYRSEQLKKGGVPPFMYLTSNLDLDTEQREAEGRAFQNSYLGANNAGTVPVMANGADIKTPALSAKDLAFIEGAGLNEEQLHAIFGIHISMTSQATNRAVAFAGRLTTYQNTFQPESEKNVAALSKDFRQAWGLIAKDAEALNLLRIKAPNLIPLDPEHELKERESYLRTGQRSIDEYRQADGVDPWGGEASRPRVDGMSQPLEETETQTA